MLPQLFRVAPVYTDVLSVTALRNVRGAHVLVLIAPQVDMRHPMQLPR